MGKREENKQKTRQAIIDAAIKLFSEKGFDKTRVSDLAEEARIGKGTIYGYFKTKSEILLAFCEDEIEYVFNEVRIKAKQESSLLERLQTLFMAQFRYVTKNNEFGRILAREMTFPEAANKESCKGLEERYLAEISEILITAISQKELRDDVELIFIVGHFYALYLIVLSAWYDGRFQTEQEIQEALHKLLTQAMEGLSPQ